MQLQYLRATIIPIESPEVVLSWVSCKPSLKLIWLVIPQALLFAFGMPRKIAWNQYDGCVLWWTTRLFVCDFCNLRRAKGLALRRGHTFIAIFLDYMPSVFPGVSVLCTWQHANSRISCLWISLVLFGPPTRATRSCGLRIRDLFWHPINNKGWEVKLKNLRNSGLLSYSFRSQCFPHNLIKMLAGWYTSWAIPKQTGKLEVCCLHLTWTSLNCIRPSCCDEGHSTFSVWDV